jgi:hypothetical protein
VIRRFRSWVKTHRVKGTAWTLSVLWVGIGAAASGYVFLVSTRTFLDPTSPFGGLFDWPGGRWSDVAVAAAALAALAWLVLAIPVLIAGVVDALGWPGKRLMAVAWAGVWVTDLALMVLVPVSMGSPPLSKDYYSGGPIANWQELVIGTGFLMLAAVMAWILARPAEPQR